MLSASRITRGQLVLHYPQPRLLLPHFFLPITRNSQQQEQDWDSSPFSDYFNLICQRAYVKSICWLWSQNQCARFNHWTRFQSPVVKSWHGALPRSWKLPGAPEWKLCEQRARKRNVFFCSSGILRAVQLIIAGKVCSVKQRHFLAKQRVFHNKQGKVSHLHPSTSQNLISVSNKTFYNTEYWYLEAKHFKVKKMILRWFFPVQD